MVSSAVWTSAKVRECYNEVEQEDEDEQSIEQDILRKSTDFLRRIIVPVEGREGVTLLTATSTRLKTTSGGFQRAGLQERSSALQ